jgi:methylglutaconyl-CoA hydratase
MKNINFVAMTDGNVSVRIENQIAFITFFHPQSNSLPGALLMQLALEIENAGVNPDARVIVLQSDGDKAFCAGASFDELIAIKNMEEGTRFFSGFAAVINAMRRAPKFVICRVQNKAVGGGVGLAAAADYTFAVNSASVKLSELAVGIGPFVVGPAVERKTGKSAFMTMTINATEWFTASWAREKGLYTNVYETIQEMDAAITALTEKLSKSNPEAMSMLKKVFWEGTEHWNTLLSERAAMSGKLVLSEFTRNAIQAFKKK